MKKTILALALLGATSAASANSYYAEITGSHLEASSEGVSVSNMAVGVNLGYNFNPEGDIQNKVELIYGLGFGDDTVEGIDVKIESFYGIAYRPTVVYDNGISAFARLGMLKAKAEAEGFGVTVSETSDWEMGAGVGLGYENFSVAYTHVDDTKIISLGYSFEF